MAESLSTHSKGFRLTPFIFGVVFVTIGLSGISHTLDADVSWVWVALLAGAGIAGLSKALGSLRSSVQS